MVSPTPLLANEHVELIITLKEQPNITLSTQEIYKVETLKRIASMKDYAPLTDDEKNYRKSDPVILAKYLLKKNTGQDVIVNNVEYNMKHRYGRAMAKSLSMQQAPRLFRACFADDYIDVDQKQAVVDTLHDLKEYFQLASPELDALHADRDGFLQRNGIDKEGLTKFLNYYTCRLESEECKKLHAFLYDELCPKLKQTFKPIWAPIERAKDYNSEGKFMARVTQAIEAVILQAMVSFMKSKGYNATTLVFDGAQFLKQDGINTWIESNELKEYIKQVTGFNAKHIAKPFGDAYALPDLAPEESEEDKQNHAIMMACNRLEELFAENKWLKDLENEIVWKPSGLSPYHYVEGPSFAKVVSMASMASRNLMKKKPRDILSNVNAYLRCYRDTMPLYERDRLWYGFKNGLLCLKDLYDGRPKLFSLDETDKIPPNLVVWNYFDIDFHLDDMETPLIDSILATQFPIEDDFTLEDQTKVFNDIKMLVFGRTLHPLGSMDKWHVMPLISGVSGCGKSTLLEVLEHIHLQSSVFSLTKKVMNEFFLGYLVEKPIGLIKDADRDFFMKMEMENFKTLVEGGTVTGQKKRKDMVSAKFETHMVACANQEIVFDQADEEVSRRLVTIPFRQRVSKKDYSLKERIFETEIVKLIVYSNHLYEEAIEQVQKIGDVHKFLHPIFSDRNVDLAVLNDFFASYFSGDISGRFDFKTDGRVLYKDVIDAVNSTKKRNEAQQRPKWNASLMDKFGLNKVSKMTCTHCGKLHVRGCCDKYHRLQRTNLVYVYGLDYVDVISPDED